MFAKTSIQMALKQAKALTFNSILPLILITFLSACGGESVSDGNGDQEVTGDTTPPVISLLGANPVEIDISSSDPFVDPGATALDNVDGDISAIIVVGGDTVDASSPGTYVLTYNVSDAAGNAASQVTRTVVVSAGMPVGSMDTTPPVITLLGANPFVIDLSSGEPFSDPGATASDDVDGDISADILMGGDTVDTSAPGTYVLTYDVSDAAGNAASQVTRTIVVSDATADTTPPEITLLGANPLEIDSTSGEVFSDPGATASDDVDGDISTDILVGGDTVDTSTPGTYVLTYDVRDAAGNAAIQVTRSVVVIDGASTNPDDYAYEISGNIYYADPVNGSDANPGTQSQPFQTIHYALNQVSGGDGLLLYGGNYGDVVWGRTGDAAWTQQPIAVVFTDWVTVKAVDGEDVIFDSLSLGTWNSPGTNTPMPFSTIGNSDLRMRFDGIQILDGIEIRGSRYVDIRNSTVSLVGDIQDRINDSGISVYNGQHVLLYHNEITHCGVGIQGMTTDFIVARNDIHHNTHDGLSMLGGSNWLVEGNTFRELDDGVDDTVSWGKHTDGTQLYFVNAPDPKWARLASDFTFRGNVFYHIESMAAMLGDSGLGRIERFTWENNVFGPMDGRMFIMAADVHDYFIFRNNSVIYAPNDSWTSMWGRTFGAAGYPLRDRYFNVQIWYGPAEDNPHQANYQVYNNIFTSATPSYQEFGLVSNNLYIDTVNETMENAEIRTTQLPYTTITGNINAFLAAGGILGALSSDSEAIDAGRDGNSPVTEDYLGTPRISPIDIGAYEY